MNKEVIKKYLDEFTRWINGGEVLCRADGNWVNVWRSAWDCSVYTFVINDEYVEFRKALAEGKTVQFNYPDVGWKDCNLLNNNVKGYRIKPDEPEFRVGMYVTTDGGKEVYTLHTTTHLATTRYILKNKNNQMKEVDNIKLWTLEEADNDEWIVYWCNDDTEKHINTVREFKDCYSIVQWDNIIPYIGQSPAELGLEK